jgi:putative transposase
MSKSRNQFKRKIDATQVFQALLTLLQSRLLLKLANTRITEADLLEVLAYASAHPTSLETACQELDQAPSGNRVREVLHAALPARAVLQRQLNTILRTQLPRSLFQGKRSYCLALDITLIPYHGQAEAEDPAVLRAQAQAGTNQFHGYATVSLVHDRRRYGLALRWVRPHEAMVAIVRDLLDRVRRLKIRIRRVYLDKEFYAVEVFRTLDRRHLAYIVPVPLRLKQNGKPTAQALCRGRSSYRTLYTLKSSRQRQRYTIALVLLKRNRRPGQKKVVRWFLYAVAGLPARITPPGVFELYRHRFGIETSYRQLHQVRARTSSRSATLRLLFVGLALILINLYATLRAVVQTGMGTGTRSRPPWLSLRRLAFLLGRAIEALFGPPILVQVRSVEGFS